MSWGFEELDGEAGAVALPRPCWWTSGPVVWWQAAVRQLAVPQTGAGLASADGGAHFHLRLFSCACLSSLVPFLGNSVFKFLLIFILKLYTLKLYYIHLLPPPHPSWMNGSQLYLLFCVFSLKTNVGSYPTELPQQLWQHPPAPLLAPLAVQPPCVGPSVPPGCSGRWWLLLACRTHIVFLGQILRNGIAGSQGGWMHMEFCHYYFLIILCSWTLALSCGKLEC